MNYYDILEVSPNASDAVIRAAYKSLIQRYHPDKNPGVASSADRATLVVQAYAVLSDASRRAAYDSELETRTTIRASVRRGDTRASHAARGNAATAGNSTYFWYLCLLCGLILVCGALILSLTNRQPASGAKEPNAAVKAERTDARDPGAKAASPDGARAAPPENTANAPATREIPVLIAKLSVNLRVPDKPAEDLVRVLSIPVLGIKVGSFDAEGAIRHIQNRKELVIERLLDKLAYARYDELIKTDREQYLSKIILDAIGDATGTNRFDPYPATASESPARYGAVEVLLPESFSVR